MATRGWRRGGAGARKHDRSAPPAVVVAPAAADDNVARCSCSCATARPTPTPVVCSSAAPTRRCRSSVASSGGAGVDGARRRAGRRQPAGPHPGDRRGLRSTGRPRRTLDRARLRHLRRPARRPRCRPRCGASGGPTRTSFPVGESRWPRSGYGSGGLRRPARRSPRPRRDRGEPRVADQGGDRPGPSASATTSRGACSCRSRRSRASASGLRHDLRSFNEPPRLADLAVS